MGILTDNPRRTTARDSALGGLRVIFIAINIIVLFGVFAQRRATSVSTVSDFSLFKTSENLTKTLLAVKNPDVSFQNQNSIISTTEPKRDENAAKPRPYQNCTGTPHDRRALAALKDNATHTDWQDMSRCVMERQKRLYGHYVLHVSKAGGTSLCNSFKQNKCYNAIVTTKVDNCWDREMGMGPKWVQNDTRTYLRLPDWTEYDTNSERWSCQDLLKQMKRHKQKLMVSENWLPRDGICNNDMLSSIIFREPMQRLLSQVRHTFDACLAGNRQMTSKEQQVCEEFYDRSVREQKVYNVTFMKNRLGMVVDNYYLRSLNDRDVYRLPFGFDGKVEMALKTAMQNLAEFDWIMLLGSENLNESTDNNIILREGLGLSSGMGKFNVRNSTETKPLTSKGEAWLRKVNTFDNALWVEAQRLHALDVDSLRRIRQFEWKLRPDFQSKDMLAEKCCGSTCQVGYDDDVWA